MSASKRRLAMATGGRGNDEKAAIASPVWTPEEDHLLRTLAEQGISRVEIAKQFRRNKNSISIRATKLSVSLKQIARSKPPKGNQSPRLRCETYDGVGKFSDFFALTATVAVPENPPKE